jgi:uncharacterized protein
MFNRITLSAIAGFLILFSIYHFPEFFPEFWIMATFKTGFLVAAFILAKLQGWKDLGGFGLGFKGGWLKQLLTGLALGCLCFGISFFVSVQAGFERITAIHLLPAVIKQLPLILLMTAVPSIAEDILTRGYVYAHVGRFMKPTAWVFLSSLIYVLNHIWRLNDGAAVLSYLFFLGLALAYAVVIGKSLWLAFGIHWGSNLAFEFLNAWIPAEATGFPYASTWVLAGVWGLLLLGFAWKHFTKKAAEPTLVVAPE